MAEIDITQKDENISEITISGELDIYCVMDTYQQLFQQLEVKEQTLLNFGGISEIDTAGVQLLIMLLKIISDKNGTYQVTSLGEPLADYSNLFQLNRYFIDFEAINKNASTIEESQS